MIDAATHVLADPAAFTDEPRLHAALTHLRAHAPVSLVDRAPYNPFWAITKPADIMADRASPSAVHQRPAAASGPRGGRGADPAPRWRPARACAR